MKKLLFTLVALSFLFSQALAGEKVLARVNGKAITETRLKELISKVDADEKVKRTPEFRKQALELLINEELLYQQACKEKVMEDAKVKKRLEDAKRRILIEALVQRHVKPKTVTEADAKAFYEKYKSKFKDANGKQVPYGALKGFIMQTLKRRAFETALAEYIAGLKKHSKVEVLKEK
jgi:peptidyl-prolyl cis-trans isomerase C